ncbi:MAG: monofunctional biosynthetic peptidoglycan transglycosylase [Deltaproteobacteria bacterium]|nr:monofunctional biosynthetic peptidoglycan transglycosylase [Deltaproteobacteria bacterium]
MIKKSFRWSSAAFAIFLLLLFVSSVIYVPHIFYWKYFNPKETALMREKGGAIIQTWVPLRRISPALRQAVIVAEDGTFYEHHGIDFFEMKEAIRTNWHKKRLARGGSTITMQLAKNLFLSSEKSVWRKIREVPLVFLIETVWSKNRILELYLNVVEWGPNLYGAQAAAQYYFGKSASELDKEEAIVLAALLPNPNRLSKPASSNSLEKRMESILRRMKP